MDDILMLEMLRNKGIGDKEFSDYMKKFFIENFARGRGKGGYGGRGMRDSESKGFYEDDHYDRDLKMYEDFYINRHSDSQLKEMIMNMDGNDKKRLMEMMSEEPEHSNHFTEQQAKYIVSQMYHNENGRKYVGEKYDMAKAKELCERYRGIIPQNASHSDVYVAVNAQYHDYCELYKAWFGDNIDGKLVESAINFWFKDDDWKGGCKIYEYFKN